MQSSAPLMLFGMLMRYCHARTVFRTATMIFGVWIFTTIISIIVVLLNFQFEHLLALKISLDFADALSAAGGLRSAGPYLLISAIAFWPVARSGRVRLLLLFSGLLGILGAMFGAGRTATFSCIIAGMFFAVARRRLWVAMPVLAGAILVAGLVTIDPGFVEKLPEQVQRALEPLNFSEEKTQVQASVSESDRWHQELRTDSLAYWNYDTVSFFLGHGYKAWDESLSDPTAGDFDIRKRVAVEMGLTENMFSSVTNIFGLAGLVLYSAFLLWLAWLLWRARQACPERSVERALSEFSFVTLLTAIILIPIAGGPPGHCHDFLADGRAGGAALPGQKFGAGSNRPRPGLVRSCP